MKQISNHIKPVIALMIVVLSFAYFFINMFNHTKPNDQILIAVVGMCGTVIGYYFGTSTGNSKKDETIQELAKKQQDGKDIKN